MEGIGSENGREVGYGIRAPGYRLPEQLSLGRVVLQVADLERSVAFYELLGFRQLEREGRTVALGPVGDDVVLVELREQAGASAAPPRGRLGLYHFAVLLPDRPALGRFLQHLAEEGMHPGASDHFVSEALYLQDPDGLGLEVYADRSPDQWAQRNGELVMATEPLDARSVLAAAAGEPWAGMPAGTRIGHVHLHVGDLEEARAFYHEALGLDQMVWSYPGALFLAAGGYHHHLGVNTWARGAAPASSTDARLLEWQMLLPDAAGVDAAAASLARAGYAPVADGAGGTVVRDPWGTALRLRTMGG